MITVLGMAWRSFDASALTSSHRDAAAFDTTQRTRPPPARRARRRARFLHGDLARGRVGGARRAVVLQAGQPLALAARHGAWDPLPDPPRPGQARPLCARLGARRRGG